MAKLFGRRVAMTLGTIRVEEGLHVEFDCTRTLKRDPNRLTAHIYNLSDQTRSRITALSEKDRVSFEAGYETSNVSEIFRGNITASYVTRSGPDIVATIEASDGGEQQFQRAWKSFEKGTKLRAAVQELVAQAGFDQGNLDQQFTTLALAGKTLSKGTIVSGDSLTALKSLLEGVGYGVSVQNNQVQILKNDAALPGTAILLNAETGMVGTPSVSIDTVTKKQVVRASALMIPEFQPGKQIRIESLAVTGAFKVERVQFRGGRDSRDFGLNVEGPIL